MNVKDFGRRLKRARQSAGYRTQADLAAAMGVDRSTVGAWESGRQYPQRFIGMLEALLGPLDDEQPRLDPETERRINSLTPDELDYVIDRLRERREAGDDRRRRA